MKIDPLSPARGAALRKNERGGGQSGAFAKAVETEGGAAAGRSVTGGAALGGLNAILALQEVPDPSSRRRRALQRGEDLLDQLERIRMGLLSGTLSREQLRRIGLLLEERRESLDDPALAEVLAEIELRAAVELAKFGG
jgi:hypothetical protein